MPLIHSLKAFGVEDSELFADFEHELDELLFCRAKIYHYVPAALDA